MTRVRLVMILGLMVSPLLVAAEQPGAVDAHGKAAMCFPCHGENGIAPTEAWPNLAGQGKEYILTQIKAFRDGARKNALMENMARALSVADIDVVATYYSSMKTGSAATSAAVAQQAVGEHVPVTASAFTPIAPHATRQYWADKLPSDPIRPVIEKKCQMCHDLQRTIAFARPKDQWQHVVESMKRRGSPVTDEELPRLVSYFTKYFGPDSPAIRDANGKVNVGMKPCKPSEWPKGSADFRSNWKSNYNVWLSNQQGGNIDIVDPVAKTIVRRINCVSAPDRIEFSRDGNTAYAPDRVEHNVTVIDTRTGAITAKVPLIDRPNTAVLSRDFKKLYVGIWPVNAEEGSRGYVQVFDTTTNTVVKTIEVKGGIHDPWMSPDGKLLLVMSPQGKFMDLFDTATDKKLWTCCTDSEVGTMAIEAGPDGSTSRIFFSYAGYPGVVAIDPKTGREVKRSGLFVDTDGPSKGVPHSAATNVGFGFHGGEISPNGKNLWVSAGSYVYKYDLPSLKPSGDVHLAQIDQAGKVFTPTVEGSWLTISPDGQKVWAVRPGRNMLSEIDVKTMKEEALFATGEYPLHISIWPRGTP